MTDKIPGTTFDNPIWYGDWRIYLSNDSDFPQYTYQFCHDDHEPDSLDDRVGLAGSVSEAKQRIDAYRIREMVESRGDV